MRHRTAKKITAATIAGLALLGTACDEGVEDEVSDVGDEVEQEVEEGVEDEG